MRPDVQNKQVEGEEPTEQQQVENSYREYTKEIERRKHRQCSKHTYGEGPTKQQVENSYGKTIEEMERLERQQLSRYHRYIGRKRRLKFTYGEEPIKQQVENSYGKTTKEEEQERAYGNPQFLKMYNSLDEKQKRPDVQNKQVEGEEPTEQQVENSYGKTTKEEEQERRHERLEIPKNIYGDDPTEQQVENSYEKTIEELQRRERRELSIMRRNEGQIRRPTYSFFQELIQHPVGNSYAKTTKEKEEEHEEPPERDYGDLRFLKHIYGDEPTEQQVESRYRKRTEEEEQKIAYGDLEFMKMYNSMTEKAKSDIRFRPIVPTERAIKRNAALLDRLLKHMSESRKKKCEEGKGKEKE